MLTHYNIGPRAAKTVRLLSNRVDSLVGSTNLDIEKEVGSEQLQHRLLIMHANNYCTKVDTMYMARKFETGSKSSITTKYQQLGFMLKQKYGYIGLVTLNQNVSL